jgi:hypothetical protein
VRALAVSRTPWGVVLAAVLSTLVLGAALIGAHLVRERRPAAPAEPAPTAASTAVDERGCRTEPCRVMGSVRVAGTTVELVADAGGRSGRLRIGGPSSSEVIEATVTDLGVDLTKSSLQCVPRVMAACIVRGPYEDGIAGQVVIGRSGKWSSLRKPFVSGAGYLALAEVDSTKSGPEVLAAQYECGGAAADCVDAPVFVQVFAVGSDTEVGCTRTYGTVDSLPGFPEVTLTKGELSTC